MWTQVHHKTLLCLHIQHHKPKIMPVYSYHDQGRDYAGPAEAIYRQDTFLIIFMIMTSSLEYRERMRTQIAGAPAYKYTR